MVLIYLATATPYDDRLLNILEFWNEFVIYFILLMFMSLNTFSAQISGSKLEDMGILVITVICLTMLMNLIMVSYSLVKPLRESLKDRESTKMGRYLRFCCKIKLPETKKCFCNCCTCGEEARNGGTESKYQKTFFLSLQPFACEHCETTDAIDYNT